MRATWDVGGVDDNTMTPGKDGFEQSLGHEASQHVTKNNTAQPNRTARWSSTSLSENSFYDRFCIGYKADRRSSRIDITIISRPVPMVQQYEVRLHHVRSSSSYGAWKGQLLRLVPELETPFTRNSLTEAFTY